MIKKGWLAILILTLLLFSSLSLAATSYASSPQVKVTLMSQDPDPVEPGQVVKVKFKIENEGAQSSQEAIVKVFPSYPFSLYSGEAEINIGKLRASSTGADAEIVEYQLKVDDGAVEDDAELELQVLIGAGGVSYTNNEFMIDIQTHDAVLAIVDITSEPSPLAPGSTGKVTIMIKNTADSLLKDIKFKLEMGGSSIPIAPYQSSSERLIAQLNSNFQQTLTFTVIAEPDAASGLYKVPLNISYNDEKGTSYTQTDVLAVTIGEAPKVRAYLKKSTVQQAGKGGKVTLEIANAGNSDLKFVELTLLPSEDYQLITTSNYFYLGDIDSDDTESEEILVYVNDGMEDKDELKIPLQLKYTDANNKPFQQDFVLVLPLYSSSELKKYGLVEKNNSWIYVVAAALVVLLFFSYRSYRKDPEKFAKRWKSLWGFVSGNGRKW